MKQGMSILHRLIAAGFGSGWVPFAPGTSGSLAALVIGFMLVHGLGLWGILAALVILLPVACRACYIVLADGGDRDPAWIVVDEWLGQWLCLGIIALFLPLTPVLAIAAFAGFRFLDIVKPWPVSAAEHWGPDWWAIQADDLVAGAISGLIIVLAGIWL